MYEPNTKHFHDTMNCSAKLLDWAELNKLTNSFKDEFLSYYGNYMDDDSTSVYALFGYKQYRFCVLIRK